MFVGLDSFLKARPRAEDFSRREGGLKRMFPTLVAYSIGVGKSREIIGRVVTVVLQETPSSSRRELQEAATLSKGKARHKPVGSPD